jgi:DsbC/DsbD-like thiol-disulfide interchange protein
MIKRSSFAILASLLMLSLSWREGTARPALPGLKTDARLVADVASVEPGTTFTTGIVLTMAPGWHIYWKNPGESGLATSITWTAGRCPRGGDFMATPRKNNRKRGRPDVRV